eukprot:s1579_g3.t1
MRVLESQRDSTQASESKELTPSKRQPRLAAAGLGRGFRASAMCLLALWALGVLCMRYITGAHSIVQLLVGIASGIAASRVWSNLEASGRSTGRRYGGKPVFRGFYSPLRGCSLRLLNHFKVFDKVGSTPGACTLSNCSGDGFQKDGIPARSSSRSADSAATTLPGGERCVCAMLNDVRLGFPGEIPEWGNNRPTVAMISLTEQTCFPAFQSVTLQEPAAPSRRARKVKDPEAKREAATLRMLKKMDREAQAVKERLRARESCLGPGIGDPM